MAERPPCCPGLDPQSEARIRINGSIGSCCTIFLLHTAMKVTLDVVGRVVRISNSSKPSPKLLRIVVGFIGVTWPVRFAIDAIQSQI